MNEAAGVAAALLSQQRHRVTGCCESVPGSCGYATL